MSTCPGVISAGVDLGLAPALCCALENLRVAKNPLCRMPMNARAIRDAACNFDNRSESRTNYENRRRDVISSVSYFEGKLSVRLPIAAHASHFSDDEMLWPDRRAATYITMSIAVRIALKNPAASQYNERAGAGSPNTGPPATLRLAFMMATAASNRSRW